MMHDLRLTTEQLETLRELDSDPLRSSMADELLQLRQVQAAGLHLLRNRDGVMSQEDAASAWVRFESAVKAARERSRWGGAVS